MSANYHVDVGSTAQFYPSVSKAAGPSAGAVVGQWQDMSNSDSFCNVYVAAGPASGPIGIQVQTAPGQNDPFPYTNQVSGNLFSGGGPLSGSFTDPTSGLAQLPTWFSSGGILWVNSGLYQLPGALGASGQLVGGYTQATLPFGPTAVQNGQGPLGFIASGTAPVFCSGGIAFAAFQRPNQYCRLVMLAGGTVDTYVQAGFLAQSMTTGSGGGFSYGQLGGSVQV